MEHFRNREEPNALEMTNVVKSVTSFTNERNDQSYELEPPPTCAFTNSQGGFYWDTQNKRSPLFAYNISHKLLRPPGKIYGDSIMVHFVEMNQSYSMLQDIGRVATPKLAPRNCLRYL